MQRKLHCFLIFMLLTSLHAGAQNIRYVSKSGAFTNDGMSWANAKINIQDAINDLVDNGLSGEVWVAEGTYTPTQTTENSGGNTLFMSFMIPAGIKVYGGFAGTESSKDERAKTQLTNMGWFYSKQTILSGDLSRDAEFHWNTTKKQFDTSFYGNCYHVVWFATNGFDDKGRAHALEDEAMLEGCVIKDGNARNNALTGRPHNAYGGGIYMVEGATVSNCYVYHCEASRDGGGIYMDGGGLVEHTYVTECQALGVSVENGYGGGICLDANRSKKASGVTRSGIVNCVARMGGGLAINVHSLTAEDGTDIRYKPYASAVLVANNTATSEGGGVYMSRGGAITQMTIVRNQCNGSGVTLSGITNGRAAGLFCKDNAYVLNSVIWGGECEANNDIQYASVRSSNQESLKVNMQYCSLSMSDFVDWSGTKKLKVLSLSTYNDVASETAAGETSSASKDYPIFESPTPAPGYLANGAHEILYNYHFQAETTSSLLNAGLLTVELDRAGVLPFPEQTYDINGDLFLARSTLGAYKAEAIVITPETVGNQVNIYVDNNRDKDVTSTSLGSSWDRPVRFFANAVQYVKAHAAELTGKTVNIYVKEGVYDNTNSVVRGRVRLLSIDIPSNVNIYGGYPSQLTGTNLEQQIDGVDYRRNPLKYPSIVSAKITSEYDINVAHLLTFNGSQNVVFDGIQVRSANATSTALGNTDKNGAGMMFTNGAKVSVRNAIIAHCTAEKGAAVYATEGSTVDFTNCIIHNNTSSTLNGIVYSGHTAQLTFDHCDFLRNVGYVGYLDGSATRQTYTNSIFFGNTDRVIANTNHESGGGVAYCLPAFAGTTTGATGSYCLFDNKSASFSDQFGGNPLGRWQYDLQYTFNGGEGGGGYPRFINPTKNTGASPSGDDTFNGRATSFEPHNSNPAVNAAYHEGDHTTWGTDISTVTTRDFGGLPDIGAVENHNATKEAEGENAYVDGQVAYGAVTYVRDYNTYTYNADGSIASVTQDLSTTDQEGNLRDGSSWARAINGNATYTTTITTTTITSVPQMPVISSSINNPSPMKMGMLSSATPGNTVYYAHNVNGNYLNSTTNPLEGDDFIFIRAGSNNTGSWWNPQYTDYYNIYNLTQGKYVTFTGTGQGAGLVQLSTSNSTRATWYLYPVNTNAGYYTHTIIPSTIAYSLYSNSWNYYGGVNNNLGLFRGSDANSKWQFLVLEESTTSTSISINGLQYAVNNANKRFEEAGGTKDHIQEVWVGAGIYAKDNEASDKSCFMIRDGVEVYGAFPKTGNPGKEQRHPLVSQYVYVAKDAQGNDLYSWQDYETILQPQTTTIQAGATRRVLGQPYAYNPNAGSSSYVQAKWDGFTLRNGVLDASQINTPTGNGGAGAAIYKNVTLQNVVVTGNTTIYNNAEAMTDFRAGGVYMDGGVLEEAYVINNLLQGWSNGGANQQGAAYGGGCYIYTGTVFNSVIANNRIYAAYADGAALFMENANFFNNTIVNNRADGTARACGGIAIWTSGTGSTLNVYNSIVLNNIGKLNGVIGDKNISVQNGGSINMYFCLSENINNSSGDNAAIRFTNCTATTDFANLFVTSGNYSDRSLNAFRNLNLRLNKNASAAINKGLDSPTIGSTTYHLADYTDMDYTERIQDCTIDIGAYEFNDYYGITPDTHIVPGQAIFYVTPNGRGLASGDSPTNAACASKLQKILDAAGRYKYLNPSTRVVVKIANSHDLESTDTPFKYYANRTTVEGEQDVRVWSIIVPRGVELWGGYTDTYVSAADNGFYSNTGTYVDRRDITAHPTYLDSYYYNKSQRNGAYTYHVLTFTDKVFDGRGLPYLENDVVESESSFTDYFDTFLSMSSRTSDRAVVDGIFITGGNANEQVSSAATQVKNIYQYGGAAIVTDYAHVRNCILRGNQGIYGGALALTHNALVSGCLIDQNTADYGGAIYVFENGTVLSDGTVVNTSQGDGHTMDANMPHVYTSTIVNNKANEQGGGIWFGQNESNVRVNSTVIWQNNSQDQANVSGLSNPERPLGSTIGALEFFPFSYCAAQNVRLSGLSNLILHNQNREGTRFAKKGTTNQKTIAEEQSTTDFSRFSDFGYYGLTNYSVLVKTGMPVAEYDILKSQGLADEDFSKTDRLVGVTRSYLDIGARAIEKYIQADDIMLRLYVSRPEDIDMKAAEDMMNINTVEGSPGYDADAAYYAQEGSSFAFPMQNLQDALDYIYEARAVMPDGTLSSPDANNLPFEICVSKGVYYPSRDISGNYGYSASNTFIIPEGVSLIGGFNGKRAVKEDGTDAGANNFYGQYLRRGIIQPTGEGTYHLEDNTEPVSRSAVTITGTHGTYTIRQLPMTTMTKHRLRSDINANSIIEPWEFTNQTVLDGNVTNVPNKGVLHVVSVFPNQHLTGALPWRQKDNSAAYQASGSELGYTSYETGQPVTLDGLTITNGYAREYIDGSIDDMDKFAYYHGGGALVDGNHYCDDYNKGTNIGAEYKHLNVANSVGYRNVPLQITKCKFEDNHAGYGAAISSNTTLSSFSCSFEHNLAEYGQDQEVPYGGETYTVTYPGHGGAVYSTRAFLAFNTMFANNEAYDPSLDSNPRSFLSLRTQLSGPSGITPPASLGGCGGAVYSGRRGYVHMVNCNFVHNMANAYPAVFTMNPNSAPAGYEDLTTEQYTQLANSVFWANEVNDQMMDKYGDNPYFTFASQLISNYGKPDRTGNYDPSFVAGNVPLNQEELDGNYQETAWFSAYEEGRAITADNKNDLRGVDLTPLKHIIPQLTTANNGVYQNCNIVISSNNTLLDGPNFNNPSQKAGYDGYMESADWSPSGLNRLTDNGCGKIEQIIKRVGESYTAEFKTYTDASQIPPERFPYSTETVGDYITSGIYTQAHFLKGNNAYNKYLPLGTDEYMTSSYVRPDGTPLTYFRVSYDPNPTHNMTYIDIGVYEYPHTQLQYTTAGDEVDILWVSSVEKPANGLPDGSDWTQPTSDLQRAIETLLVSRNGHRKEIRLLEGEYTPIYSIDGHLAFTIDTRALNKSVLLPLTDLGQPIEGHGVLSLTIKGGYSKDLNNVYDVNDYPAVIRQQSRVDAETDRWNHLIYIKDATQRYGLLTYNRDNGFGWWKTEDLQESQLINTIPVEIDGVTVINDQALPGTQGAAIRYSEPKFDNDENLNQTTSNTNILSSSPPTPAHISKITYYKDEDMTEVSDVPTPFYIRQQPVYYTDASYTVVSDTPTDFVKYGFEEKTDPAKFILNKSHILGSGTHYLGAPADDASSSAVYLAPGGGYALLYNNVMHTNYGDPLESECQTLAINNTFALNRGKVQITGGDATHPSQIFNSVFWRNNPTGPDTYGDQFSLTNFVDVSSSGDIFRHNAYTGGDTDHTDYQSGPIVTHNYNVGLSTNNIDVINGPNFVDPEHANIEKRDFSINPSLRLLHKGKSSLYEDNLANAYNVYDLAWLPTTRQDPASNARFVREIDVGAYEYQNDLERVIYVNPNSSSKEGGDSWATPLGYGHLQTAIDLAAVYHVNNPSEEAYVFVKGASLTNPGLHTGETLTLRDGVTVYGGILPSLSVDCNKTVHEDGLTTFDETDLADYVTYLRNSRDGVVSTLGNKTAICGIRISPNSVFNTTDPQIVSLVDGFHVMPMKDNVGGIVTSPVIDVRPSDAGSKVALRHLLVSQNDLSATPSTHLAEIDNALIYEALFHGNSVAPDASVLHLGPEGYAVNITAEGKTIGANGEAPYNGSDESHLYYSLVNYSGHPETEHTLSGYSYAVSDANLNYQLTEQSKHIDECPAENPISAVPTLAGFIDYSVDRDLLGNPRLLKGVSSANKIDRGAFETWRVDQPVVKTTAEGHFYPHDGSVVYVMEGHSLVSGHSMMPAYLLMKEGSSLYGQGNAVNAAYLAVERTVNAGGSVVSMPYKMDYAGQVGIPAYDADGVLSISPDGTKAYTYNGSARAAWDYAFMSSNSQCWDEVDDEVEANVGVLFDSQSENLYRFTGKGSSMKNYIYVEEVDGTHKQVTLTQHDDRESTSGGADFTSKEDMGWNCLGLPYLVSTYKPYELETFTGDSHYNLDIPHELWLYYDGKFHADGTTLAEGDGGFAVVPSWDGSDWHLPMDETARIWMGEGFFTQTAAVSAEEPLTFYRPVYQESGGSKGLQAFGKRFYKDSSIEVDLEGTFRIYAQGHQIHVTGLEGGELISIYDPSGRVYKMSTATSTRYVTSVPVKGIYLVKVSAPQRTQVKKVIIN